MVNCLVFLAISILCFKFSTDSIHFISFLSQPTVMPVEQAERMLPIPHTLFCVKLPSPLPFPLGAFKPGRSEKPRWCLAPGTFLLVCFTKNPYHNPNETFQNSFNRTNRFPKHPKQTKNCSITLRKNQHPTHKATHLSDYSHTRNILLFKMHLKAKIIYFLVSSR